MTKNTSELSRRLFLETTLAAGVAALAAGDAAAQSRPKYTRYNIKSAGGQKALASYAKGVGAMLKLPPDNPHNWFRNAFVHLMDCPHGNWWFYVWHRGFVGYFEESIRNLSGDPTFAMPYWDWTTQPEIPAPLFDGALSPQNAAFAPYIGNLAVFTSYIQPAMTAHWKTLSAAQLSQLKARGYDTFDKVWNDVTGYNPEGKPKPFGVTGNVSYANPSGARYLTRDNPKFDEKTAYSVSEFIVDSGLLATDFYNPKHTLSFNSSKASSHNAQPGGPDSFSVLEGFPHNKVHNYIGGVGPLDPGPYGFMTNFLSPVDPIFFLHHSNMDRLWDVWTRKQKRLNLPYLPTGADLATLSNEPFLFYVNGKGEFVGPTKAGDYLNMERFDYDYEPGYGEIVVQPPPTAVTSLHMPPVLGGVLRNTASLSVPSAVLKSHMAATGGASLIAQVTIPRPDTNSSAREFDVIVGAPPGITQVDANSPYYAGTVAFFGNMMNMSGMASEVTFSVPLPRRPVLFRGVESAANAVVNIRVVPSQGHGSAVPLLKSASIRAI